MRSILAAAKIALIFVLAHALAAEAAEVKVITGVGMAAVWEQLGPEFERATGHKVVIWYGHVGAIKRRIEGGEAFDLAVTGSLGEYIKQGKIVAATRTEIARVGMGVGVRTGATKPDISSTDAFKRALLNAKSVTYNPLGAGGIHVVRVFERLGIGEQMKAKAKPQHDEGTGGRVLHAVANGDAELGFALTNQLVLFSGVELVGPFPPELQRYNLYSAGVATAAEQPQAAEALIDFLRSPAAAAVIKAKGMEPVVF